MAGIEPFSFARNANLGIDPYGKHDVVLVNDDVQFTRGNSLADLERAAYSEPGIGIVSPVVLGTVGNPLQRRFCAARAEGVAISPRYLAFVCVYIKRAVIDAVGLFDEGFTGYGGDDIDYSYRTQRAGFKLAVTSSVIVKHGFGGHASSSSFARSHGNTGASMADMNARFREKWGVPPDYSFETETV